MSIVIVGGNDSMVHRYKSLCEKYRCRAKVFTQPSATLREKIGTPDLLVLFTNTVSHKMVRCAISNVHKDTIIARSHSSSMAALEKILETHAVIA